MQSNIQLCYPSFYTFYESQFFPGQTPVPPRSGTWILDLSHDPNWAIWLAEVRKFHQHHDRICYNEIWIYNVGQENKPCKQCMHFHISCHSWSFSQTLWTWPIPTTYNQYCYKHTMNNSGIYWRFTHVSFPSSCFLPAQLFVAKQLAVMVSFVLARNRCRL